MRQKFQHLSTEELQALHGDSFLEIVIVTRARIQKMNPEKVAEATSRSLQCILNFVTGETRVPRSSTLSAMLKHIVAVDGVGEVAAPPRQFPIARRRAFPGKPRFVRPVRRSVARGQMRA